jgi:hypothetical protein
VSIGIQSNSLSLCFFPIEFWKPSRKRSKRSLLCAPLCAFVVRAFRVKIEKAPATRTGAFAFIKSLLRQEATRKSARAKIRMEVDVELLRVCHQGRKRRGVISEMRVRHERSLLRELEMFVGQVQIRADG